MRALITGASGFAGGYLAHACAAAGDEVLGLSRSGRMPDGDGGTGRAVDLRDERAVRALLRSWRPDVVYHLAALSSVGRSWEEPVTTVSANTQAAAALLEALRREAPGARVVWVSSCEVYGTAAELPIVEDTRLNPVNPYAVSKVAGDLLAGVYAEAHGLDLVRARPFNHAGPGQLPIFIVSSLARQAAAARVGGERHLRLVTGNPETRRDFTDVRDVVRAYRLLGVADADTLAAQGRVFNVSSGRSMSAGEQVELLARLLEPIEVEHVVDPARVRAHEVMDLRGSPERIHAAVGWKPEISFEQTLAETVEWWQEALAGSAGV